LPGQQYDEESGLYYNRHRYYDPLQGRYITQDPIGLKGGWNFYQYPLNPVTNTDPLGLEVFPREGANKRGNSSRLTQSFHFFMFEPIFSPVNALNQPI
ncbi:RHS repeat-associated core domain-containing protein, partial [Escherichia coli]|uniref:RHS repeat-associated core domain-containing protein n=1 Tax=Escherichia coli TaxID=562 RepID=UPI00188A954E